MDTRLPLTPATIALAHAEHYLRSRNKLATQPGNAFIYHPILHKKPDMRTEEDRRIDREREQEEREQYSLRKFGHQPLPNREPK